MEMRSKVSGGSKALHRVINPTLGLRSSNATRTELGLDSRSFVRLLCMMPPCVMALCVDAFLYDASVRDAYLYDASA